MLTLSQVYLFILSSAVLAATPGPDILTVLARGISQGRKEALMAALGFSLGCINHTLIVMLGVAALIKASPLAFAVIKYAGAAYLVWVGVQIIKNRNNHPLHTQGLAKNLRSIFFQSILANLLNPKVTLFFLAFLPRFVKTEANHESLQILQLGVIFILITLCLFSTVAVFAGSLGNKLKEKPKAFSYFQTGAGIFIILLALALFAQ